MHKLTTREIKNYHGLLFDLDGTLLNSQQKIPPLALAQINRFRQAGFKIGLCTGRQYGVIKPHILPLFHPDDIHIVSNGAHLITTAGQTVWKKSIPSQTSSQIYHFANQHAARIYFCQNSYAYTNLNTDRKHNLGYQTQLAPPNLKDWTTSLIEIEAPSPEITAYIQQLASQKIISFTRILDVISKNYYLIITANGVGKGRAAKIWARHWCMNYTEIIGFGNGANDIDLIKTVGHGVAMGDSEPQLLPLAHEIIGTADQDSIGQYLTQFVFE